MPQVEGSTSAPEVRMKPDPLVPNISGVSRARARELRSRAERRTDIPLRASFVRRERADEMVPPLARLVGSGGRGGATALRLYLGIVWLASAPPFDTPQVPARGWAELLDLEEPATKGRARVVAALNKLEACKLIEVNRAPGEASAIQLLHESGTGRRYRQIPSSAYRAADARRKERYLKINTQLWINGWIQTLSAKALAMLLVILEETYGDYDQPVWWTEQIFTERFALSRATRSEGALELSTAGLIRIKRAPVAPAGAVFAQHKVRNTYVLTERATPAA